MRDLLPALSLAVVMGMLSVPLGWASPWFFAVLAGFALSHVALFWLQLRRRHRSRSFGQVAEILGEWADWSDRGARIFVRAESGDRLKLRFGLRGRGDEKLLGVSLPKRDATAGALRARLESLCAACDTASFIEHPQSFWFQLPARARYTGAVAALAARAAFEIAGHDDDARFTVWEEEVGLDPEYLREVKEQMRDFA